MIQRVLSGDSKQRGKAGHTRILVVDDELPIIKYLRARLESEGFETITAVDGAQALRTIESEFPDLIILDRTLPKVDGIEVCRRLREWSQIPVIMLSGRDAESEMVECLNLGADDYITKPFQINELIARIKAVLRRTEAISAINARPSFNSGDLQVNFMERYVTVAGNEVRLTPIEYNLLQELVLNAGKVLTHRYLLNKIWGPEYGEENEYIRVFVSRLRAKLEVNGTMSRCIITVPAVGYKYDRRVSNRA